MLLALVAFAVSTTQAPIRITPADGAIGVDPATIITIQTAEPHPTIEIYEGVSGVRVGGTFEPFVARPNGAAVMRFAPTRGFKPGVTYKVLFGGRTFSFTTKPKPRAIPPILFDYAPA